MKHDKFHCRKTVIWILSVIYFAVLFWLLVAGRTPLYNPEDFPINLTPLHTVRRYLRLLDGQQGERLRHIAVVNLLGNVGAFLPFGWLVPNLWRRMDSVLWLPAAAAVCAAAAEFVQLFTARGVFDVDDILLNALGAVIGFLGYRAAKTAGRRRER